MTNYYMDLSKLFEHMVKFPFYTEQVETKQVVFICSFILCYCSFTKKR